MNKRLLVIMSLLPAMIMLFNLPAYPDQHKEDVSALITEAQPAQFAITGSTADVCGPKYQN